ARGEVTQPTRPFNPRRFLSLRLAATRFPGLAATRFPGLAATRRLCAAERGRGNHALGSADCASRLTANRASQWVALLLDELGSPALQWAEEQGREDLARVAEQGERAGPGSFAAEAGEAMGDVAAGDGDLACDGSEREQDDAGQSQPAEDADQID